MTALNLAIFNLPLSVLKLLCLQIHDLTSKSEADESSLHSDQVIPRSVSSMYSFSSIPAHPQASLAPSLSTKSMVVSQESLSDESVSLSSAVSISKNNVVILSGISVSVLGPSFTTVIEGCDDIGLLLHSLPQEKNIGLLSNIKYVINIITLDLAEILNFLVFMLIMLTSQSLDYL